MVFCFVLFGGKSRDLPHCRSPVPAVPPASAEPTSGGGNVMRGGRPRVGGSDLEKTDRKTEIPRLSSLCHWYVSHATNTADFDLEPEGLHQRKQSLPTQFLHLHPTRRHPKQHQHQQRKRRSTARERKRTEDRGTKSKTKNASPLRHRPPAGGDARGTGHH